MQVINVKLQNGVFVPLEPINIGEDYEAVVVIGGKRVPPVEHPEGTRFNWAGRTEESTADLQSKARQYFKENFPDLEVSENILELVGILRGYKGKLDKAEYHEYLGRKYK
ncbi:MAG: DUF104 domain-containing protein [Nitrospiraceae bacterium]|nr:DUF104 domain-containing protein [Nitrospiraceae bacterium]